MWHKGVDKMIIAVGMDVHKDKCAACARFAGKGEPKPKHEEFLKNFNKEFRRFDSDDQNS